MKRSFSINVKSRKNLRTLTISDSHNGVIVEGDLGELKSILLLEGLMLEIKGVNGTLRFDITKSELKQVLLTKDMD
jgi:hypothetical protein